MGELERLFDEEKLKRSIAENTKINALNEITQSKQELVKAKI